VTVVDSNAVRSRPGSTPGLSVRPALGEQTGFSALALAVLECERGDAGPIVVGSFDETLFVVSGRGTLRVEDREHVLEPEVGAYIAPGSEFHLHNPGPEVLRLVAVRVAKPEGESEPAPRGQDQEPVGAAVRTLADQQLEHATAQRDFRIVADPDCGLRSATHFVGYIPTTRAPDHFHHYDEVIYVLDGSGVMHAGDLEQPLAPGSCIQLPARTVHCLENTGTEPMRVVAVFCPAGSPAAAFYPDGTPAYQGANEPATPEEELQQ
jgi:mannose-6-phosphate isomerase-like protein (cupin superfamily)